MDDPYDVSDGGEPASTGILRWAVRTAAIVVVVGLAATHYLAQVSNQLEPTGRVQIAGATKGRTILDPETTGSIGAARASRLDPCALAPTRAARP